MPWVDAVGQLELVGKQLTQLDVERGLDAPDSVLVIWPFATALENTPHWGGGGQNGQCCDSSVTASIYIGIALKAYSSQ